eukprot:13166315-Ditylum_brightwellii.AAC.1
MGNSNRHSSIVGRKGTSTKQPGVAGITSSRKYSTASGRQIFGPNYPILRHKSINEVDPALLR